MILIFLGVGVFSFWRMKVDDDEVTVSTTASLERDGRCTARERLDGLGTSTLSGLRSLARYRDVCGSFVTDRVMCFANFPGNRKQARSIAHNLSLKLSEYRRLGIVPLIVFEPRAESGEYVPLAAIASGEYDSCLRDLFTGLEENGITGAMIGEWVPYPEVNTPVWDKRGFSPGDFPAMVNRFLDILRERYPEAKGMIILNASSYDPGDVKWEHARYEDFSAYIEGIRPGTLQDIGIQGFPWKSGTQGAEAASMSPDRFLRVGLVESAAKRLGIGRIWINSGTFGSIRRGRSSATCSPAERAIVLGGILRNARALKRKGYEVSINLFAEDKRGTDEAVDWSYGDLGDPRNPLRNVLYSFTKKSDALGIGIGYFDR